MARTVEVKERRKRIVRSLLRGIRSEYHGRRRVCPGPCPVDESGCEEEAEEGWRVPLVVEAKGERVCSEGDVGAAEGASIAAKRYRSGPEGRWPSRESCVWVLVVG